MVHRLQSVLQHHENQIFLHDMDKIMVYQAKDDIHVDLLKNMVIRLKLLAFR